MTIIGHRFDLPRHALRDFLARNRVAYRWHDLRDPEARRGLPAAPHADEAYPVVLFPDGTRLVTPSFRARGGAGSGCRRCRPMPATTWRSSAPGRPASPRRSTARPEGLSDDPDRARSAGRTGRDVVTHRELPRLPDRRVAATTRPARVAAGEAIRYRDSRRARRCRHRGRRRRSVACQCRSTAAIASIRRTIVIATGVAWRNLGTSSAPRHCSAVARHDGAARAWRCRPRAGATSS